MGSDRWSPGAQQWNVVIISTRRVGQTGTNRTKVFVEGVVLKPVNFSEGFVIEVGDEKAIHVCQHEVLLVQVDTVGIVTQVRSWRQDQGARGLGQRSRSKSRERVRDEKT